MLKLEPVYFKKKFLSAQPQTSLGRGTTPLQTLPLCAPIRISGSTFALARVVRQKRKLENILIDCFSVSLQNIPPNYHVIAVDLPGHGNSNIPAAIDDLSMCLMLDALRQVSN